MFLLFQFIGPVSSGFNLNHLNKINNLQASSIENLNRATMDFFSNAYSFPYYSNLGLPRNYYNEASLSLNPGDSGSSNYYRWAYGNNRALGSFEQSIRMMDGINMPVHYNPGLSILDSMMSVMDGINIPVHYDPGLSILDSMMSVMDGFTDINLATEIAAGNIFKEHAPVFYKTKPDLRYMTSA